MKQALIGITADIDDGKSRKHFLHESYAAALYHAHCAPLLLAAPDLCFKAEYEALAERFIACVDGLLLSGGDDVNALLYKEENYAFNGAFTEERDLFEIALCRCAVYHGKPVLGICRGIQSMNVALGGSLFQDIAAQYPDKRMLGHYQKAPAYSASHEVELAYSSTLAHILLGNDSMGDDGGVGERVVSLLVNSFHHQAVKRVAPGFVAVAHAHDGVIEAIEPVTTQLPQAQYGQPHPFTIGVQWHPERMYLRYKHAERLFQGFAAACVWGGGGGHGLTNGIPIF
ncbi:MAG: gamma-glutamyl-gamma-aminobutyrate hydrolase family protein [Treponema sp.]|jgi:putative glutamine amidotransferase|nr:gamma-glutamyl-gamma-aminobutyrate hydrolase family protein [Treponema sp.]